MDRSNRESAQAEIEAKILDKQRVHIAALESLEANHGLDLDALTDLYGSSVLNGNEKTAVSVLEQWQALLEKVASDEPYVAVVGMHKKLAPGCYGFGQRARYDLSLEVVMLDDSLERTVTFARSADGKQVSAAISGHGFVLDSEAELPEYDQAAPVTFTLVSIDKDNILGGVNNFQRVESGLQVFDLYSHIDRNIANSCGPSSPHARVTSWLLRYPRESGRISTASTEVAE